jgi:hypothetical protein
MTAWLHVVLLALPGFFFNFQPSEPYLTRYLIEDKNISHATLDLRVWPTETYSSLAFAIPVGILAEMVGFLPVVFVGMAMREATRIILIFGEGLELMMTMQATYALGHATLAVYYALPFLFLSPEDFAIGTAAQHALYHLGNLLGSGLAQGLVLKDVVSLKTLFFISWGATTTGLIALIVMGLVLRRARSAVKSVPYNTLWSEIRHQGIKQAMRNFLDLFLIRSVAASCVGLCLIYACWAILGNYFQENLVGDLFFLFHVYSILLFKKREHGLPKALFGFVELGVEGVFVLGTLPAILLTPQMHFKSFFFSGSAAVLLGAPLVAVSLLLEIDWPFALALNLAAFLGYSLSTSVINTLIAQVVNLCCVFCFFQMEKRRFLPDGQLFSAFATWCRW